MSNKDCKHNTRCPDCQELLNEFELDLIDLYEGFCEDCFGKNVDARNDIMPHDEQDFLDGEY